MINVAKKYQPAVLQNESHPYLHEKDLRNFCAINNIAFQVDILFMMYSLALYHLSFRTTY